MPIPAISVIIPFYNEAGNVIPLVEATIHSLKKDNVLFNIILVDDASRDSTYTEILTCTKKYPEVTGIRHLRQKGQSAALRTGVLLAPYEWILTLDGDGQNNPADILFLLKALKNSNNSQGIVIFGNRPDRRDPLFTRICSRLANGIRQFILKDQCPDTGCGLKLFPRQGFMSLPHFNHFHRYLPSLFQMKGYCVINVPVTHRPRTRGKSKYGFWNRFLPGIWDLLGVLWLKNRQIEAEIATIEGQLHQVINSDETIQKVG